MPTVEDRITLMLNGLHSTRNQLVMQLNGIDNQIFALNQLLTPSTSESVAGVPEPAPSPPMEDTVIVEVDETTPGSGNPEARPPLNDGEI